MHHEPSRLRWADRVRLIMAIGCVALILLGGAAVALSASNPAIPGSMRGLVDVVDSIVGTRRFASGSNLVPVAELYFTLVAFTFPLSSVYFYLSFSSSGWLRARKTRKQVAYGFLLAAVGIGLGVLSITAFHGQDNRYFAIGSSETSLAIFGWVPVVSCGFLVGLGLAALVRSLQKLLTNEE